MTTESTSHSNPHAGEEPPSGPVKPDFRTLAGELTEVILLCNASGMILFANPAVRQALEAEPGELEGKTWFDLASEEDGPMLKERLAALMRRPGIPMRIPRIRFRSGSGGIRNLEAVATNLLHCAGIHGVVVNLTDITDRVRLETELRESQLLLKSITANLVEGIYRSTPTRGPQFVNEAFVRMFGYQTVEEVLKTPSRNLYVNPEARQELIDLIHRDGMFRNCEVLYARKDGSQFWGLTSCIGIRDESGEVCYYDGTIIDITHRKAMESALRTSEQRWTKLFEQSPLSIQVFDQKGRTIQVSRAWEELFGTTLESMQGMSILDDPQLASTGQMEILRKAFEGEVVQVPPAPFDLSKAKVKWGSKGKGVRWIGGLLFPLFDDRQQVREVICIHDDITERKLALEKLEKSESITRAISAFATSLIHQYTEEDILWDITRRCIEALGFVDCVVYTLDEQRKMLIQRAAYGPKNPKGREILSPIEIPLGEGIVGSVAATGRHEIISDTRLDRRYIVDDAQRLSEITVPIVSEGRVLGVIDSEHPEEGFFTQEHLVILSSIASVCAHKLVRARAERELLRLNEELERRIGERTAELLATNARLTREIEERARAERVQTALFRISEAVHAERDLPSFYARIHSNIAGLMQAANFYIALEDPETGIVSFPYHVDECDPCPVPRKGHRGITEYVLRSGKACLANLKVIESLKRSGEYTQTGAPAKIWLGVPLRYGDRVFGVMALQDHRNEHAFGEEEKQILMFVADQTGLAIERKRAEAALQASAARLRASEELFSKAFHATPSVLAISRLEDGKFIDVNESFLQIIGRSRTDVIGRNAQDLGLWDSPEERDRFLDEIRRGDLQNKERRFRVNGQPRVFLHSAEQIVINSERCLLTAAVDITERKQAEEELLKALGRERELGALKSQFVSTITHEFRTPLSIILSSADLLDRYLPKLSDAERHEQLESVKQSARRMADMMEEVLLSARADAGQLQFEPVPLDLPALCIRVSQEILTATSSRCEIDFDNRAGGLQFRGDESLLRHILSNLLSNAVKYSPAGSCVDFSLAFDGEEGVEMRIRDRGMGIRKADRERLFNAFQRGRNVGHLPGTGLGLVIVKRCVELHGGSIAFESVEGQGTEVTVKLPNVTSETKTSFRRRITKS